MRQLTWESTSEEEIRSVFSAIHISLGGKTFSRYIVAVTGKGPVGKFTGKWMNAIDERGLPAHCVRFPGT